MFCDSNYYLYEKEQMEFMINLCGKKFGLLVVKELDITSKNKRRWICDCECGTMHKSIQENHLKSLNTKSCGCLHSRRGSNSPFFKGCGELSLDQFSSIRRSAKGGGNANRKTKEFTITIEDAWNQFIKQNKCCALTGLELSFNGTHKENKRTETSKRNASLDRIDSTKGYIVGNIQWVHKDINIMKNDLDMESFIYYCRLVNEN